MIHYLLRIFGWPLGLRFAPDGQVMPILRWGRLNRVRGPGVFWVNPLLEQTLPSVYIGGRLANLTFIEVISSDNIPFTFHLTILYAFRPNLASVAVIAPLIRLPKADLDARLETIVKSFTGEELLNLVSTFRAEEICNISTRLAIKRDLIHHLNVHLHDLGFTMRNVLLQGIAADKKFRHTMLNVEQHEATLRKLREFEDNPDLIDQAMQAELLDSLEEREGDLNFISTLDLDYLHHPRGQPHRPRPGQRPALEEQ